ncbi:AAA family ATPase [Accumulibacter sp.]|uniref:AAA family ATPase n=1 Tax=Accumulibacter sp. TaxID=2053492 RepID=UPI002588AB36|nr:AAA family ATPase [Accumulibacter sp.]
MRLKSFHVRVFRNIIDSGSIEVDRSTCIVGKNEAGKSSIIEALHRLNPAKPCPLMLLDDYPRWLKKEHETSGEIDKAVPISAEFELSEEEIAELEDAFCEGVLDGRVFTAMRKYTGDFQLTLPINQARFIAWFSAEHVDGAAIGTKLTGATSSSDLVKKLAAIAEEKSENGEPTPAAQAAKLAKAALDEMLDGAPHIKAALEKTVRAWIPKTFLFGEYSQLRGRYNLNAEVIPALTTSPKDEDVQAAADFLKLAKADAKNVSTWDFEQLNAELEAVSSQLTRKVKASWKQNQHLKLRVRIEPEQQPNGQIERFLQFRVEDTRHDFSNRLDRRSTGFRWFVSFMASFFEFQKNENIILLLDEPGLSLHARAQKDLMDAIDTNLTEGRQVIYTTHSPFMVRTEALNRVRIVEDKGPDLGAMVTNEAGAISDPDTLFPLQAALGYDVAQNLFIGNRNILLEGTSDFVYLMALSTHLGSLGRTRFPTSCRLLPAGGATNIPTFIALLGGKVGIVVLLDGKAQRQRIDTAITHGRLKASNVLSVEQFCNVKGADIEDLFEPHEYLAIYNAALGTNLKAADLQGQDRIVKRIERMAGDFDHGRIAAHFLVRQHEIIPTLSAQTLKRFEDTISALVQALPPEAPPQP